MGKWTAEKMTQELEALLQKRLVSVVLFGSAAAGDHLQKHSDINLMVITHPLDPKDLQALSKAVVPWVKQGNPPPLFLTEEHLRDFTDVFPLEILDIQSNHRVLYGEDGVSELYVSNDHLRVELEHEIQGKLLQLKSRYILTEGKPRLVLKLMMESLSTFLVLFKNALWLYGDKPPARKMEAVQKLGQKLGVDISVLETLEKLKRGEKISGLDLMGILSKYLTTIENLAAKINGSPS